MAYDAEAKTKGFKPTSGFYLVWGVLASQMCTAVDLYGFGRGVFFFLLYLEETRSSDSDSDSSTDSVRFCLIRARRRRARQVEFVFDPCRL